MRFNQWMTFIAAGTLFASAQVMAVSATVREQLQVPQCLAGKITLPHKVLAENSKFKLIEMDTADIDSLSHLADKVHCGRFVNVTPRMQNVAEANKKQRAAKLLSAQKIKVTQSIAAYDIQHTEAVQDALAKIVPENIWQNLTHLTSYYNRSATKPTGVETANWLKTNFEAMAAEYGRQDIDTFFVNTGNYKQPSLVTVIGKGLTAPGVVIGAHMDTLDGFMPGAGDDGSGSATAIETARVLLANKNTLNRPVYIIWYAAEERGLVGSQYVVKHFKQHNIPVSAVLQLDMTGYRNNASDPTMWVFTDHVDRKLSNFVAKLIDHYIKVPVDYSTCGYGCSDHASWDDKGIPAAFPCETSFEEHNPYIHSKYDTMELISLEHMTNFTKLAVAFALELALV
ncbi:MAG: aminopeptidase [Legionella sp. 40-6]|nr:M20/M25/M40 family metallo-hydrolase [Legionella sp.]OJY14423.1 MAG: aminopeptidase [Legionella sp. 40-6]